VEALVEQLAEKTEKVVFYAADLSTQDAADDLVERASRDFETIDAVIANAGGDIKGDDAKASGGKADANSFFVNYDDHESIFKRNYYTCLHTLRSVVPILVNQGYGKIITISSVSGGFGVPKETSYATAKAAVVHLTRCLAVELRDKGINVNCIMPGPITTGRFMATLESRNSHDLKDMQSSLGLTRIGKPEDICPVVEFLLSSGSDFISGQIIRVDGGLFSQPV
jgi:3-oxoacyl-[acyl-carrier protein] reductase